MVELGEAFPATWSHAHSSSPPPIKSKKNHKVFLEFSKTSKMQKNVNNKQYNVYFCRILHIQHQKFPIFNDFLKFTLFRKVQEGAQNAPFDDQTRWFLANSLVSREGTVQTLCWQAQRQTVYGYTNKSAIRFGLDLKLYLSENLCISMTMHKSLTGSPQSLPFLVSFFPRKALLVQQIGRRRLWPNPK